MTIYMTLDNVLTDFEQAANAIKSLHPEINSRESFWDIANTYPTFWSNMVSNRAGIILYNSLRGDAPIILTSIPNISIGAYQGKREWVDNNLGYSVPMFAGLQSGKHLLCNTGDVLYDDNDSNLEKWEGMGGISIKVDI